MALKATLTKEEFEALAEPVREFYKQDGDKYEAQMEGFSPKTKVDEFRTTNIRVMKERDDLKKLYEGIDDPEKAREALKKLQELEEKKLIEAGEVDKVVETRVAKMREEHKKEREKLEAELKADRAQLSSLLIDKEIERAAIKVGVKPEAMDVVVMLARDTWKLEKGKPVAYKNGEQIFGANGSPMEIEEWVSGLKPDREFLFGKPKGADAPGGDNPPPGFHKKRSEMTRKEKSDYVDKHGQDQFLKLPK